MNPKHSQAIKCVGVKNPHLDLKEMVTFGLLGQT